MTDETPRYYVTTPIYYVNDVPHIGHAYTTLACDVLARFHRLDGREVLFLTGTDEHGQKVEKAAAAAGIDPQSFCDRVSRRFRDLLEVMDFSPDDFIRTTEPRHVAAAQELWRRMEANGHIYEGVYAGWYSVRDEAFYQEGELVEGPNGERLAPTGAPVEWVEEPSLFFRLSAFEERLLAFYDAHPDFVLPQSRMNEVRRFVAGGLKDLSISRTSFSWGIPVPGHPGHIMYVWVDALTNYLSALGFPDESAPRFRRFWPADLHMVGKDILRFHAVYWPAFLMAAGLEPPRRVFAHGWWTNEGQKISKSLGNVIDPFALVEEFGVDPVRYFLLRAVPFGQDGDFARQAFVARVNADLANDFGNLAQRVLSMIYKNCAGRIPEPGTLEEDDRALLDSTAAVLEAMRAALAVQAFHEAIEALWTRVGEANGYVARMQPWALKKTDPQRMATVLWTAAEAIRRLAILAQPFTPRAMARLLDQMGVPAARRCFADLSDPEARLAPGTAIERPQGVFPRLVLEEA